MPETARPNRDELGHWVKGVSGNPAGKPPGSGMQFTTKVRIALEKLADGEDYTNEEALILTILRKGIKEGDVGMIRTIWEQLDGKPLQRLANADGQNLDVKQLYGIIITGGGGLPPQADAKSPVVHRENMELIPSAKGWEFSQGQASNLAAGEDSASG